MVSFWVKEGFRHVGFTATNLRGRPWLDRTWVTNPPDKSIYSPSQ